MVRQNTRQNLPSKISVAFLLCDVGAHSFWDSLTVLGSRFFWGGKESSRAHGTQMSLQVSCGGYKSFYALGLLDVEVGFV